MPYTTPRAPTYSIRRMMYLSTVNAIADLHFEGLCVFWDLTSFWVNSENLSCEKRDHTNAKRHQKNCICAEEHAHLCPVWRVTLVLGQLIHTHPVRQKEDSQHGCKGHRQCRGLKNLLNGNIVVLQSKAISCHAANSKSCVHNH